VVSIKNNDILTSSPMEYRGDINGNVIIAAPGQRSFDSWYEGF